MLHINKMKPKFNFTITMMTIVLSLSFLMVSCIKDNFDEPPSTAVDPTIGDNQIISLTAVLSKRIPNDFIKINEDKYIKGVVVADDRSGNFYKTIIVEDENSDLGISVLIDEVELYNIYPVGRRVFIHVKDLWIGDYNGLPQLGYGPYLDAGRKRMASIPSTIFKDLIKPGATGIEVKPAEVTIAQLGEARLNTLIKINGVQFKTQGETYADAVTQSTLNKTITTCANQEIVVRTSGFADFAGTKVPDGKGSIVAVYSIFGTDKQLTIRDPKDAVMTEARCGAATGDEPRLTIKDVRALYKGTATNAPKSFMQGVVISDALVGKNINSRNVTLQDGDAGIIVRFAANHSFPIGKELKILTTDVEISEFNGLLQLNNVPLASATVVKDGTLPTPAVVTLKTIKDNLEKYESVLVEIKDAEISGGATYGASSGNLTLTDATGTMILRTASTAAFAATAIKTGKVSVKAIVSEFTTGAVTPQLNMRSADDVTSTGTGGGGGGGGGTPTRVSVEALRAAYKGVKTTAPDGFIQGVVISDLDNKNIQIKNVVIQDGNFGIVVRLVDNNTLTLGKEVKISTNGIELSEFNKLLQLNNVPTANITVIGNGVLPTPKVVTVKDIKDNLESHESTLVTIKGVTITGTTTMSGTQKVTDSTGTIDMFSRTDSAFASSAVPSGSKDITAIVSEFTTTTVTPQLTIRSLSDIK
jgi:hypothetical protein